MKHWATCKFCGRKFFKFDHGAYGTINIKCPSCKEFSTFELSDCGQMWLPVKLDAGAYMPERAHGADAGMDLRTPVDVFVPAGGYAIIDTGVHVEIPDGYVGMLKSKSGLNVNHNLVTEGVIDSGYTGSIAVKIYNHGIYNNGLLAYRFNAGDKIAQLVVMPVSLCKPVEVSDLTPGERGNAGFGSTGK